MKSIRKKAIETCPTLEGDLHGTSKNLIRRDGFYIGADYVLEQIEDVLTNPRRYVNSDKSVEEGMVDAIIKCVEQLKSNK